jgi:hypothetical protein
MTSCGRCGKTWQGFRLEHCTVCHETFTGTGSGDRHRIGPYWPAGLRRCRTPQEMQAAGMAQNYLGYWVRHRRPETTLPPDRHNHPSDAPQADTGAGAHLGTP